jgi:very-short-patch-repair endonuclease
MAGIAQDFKFAYAQKLRANPTRFEQKVWNCLRKGVRGLRFSRQIVVRGYVVDFYCHKVRLAIELDGKSHDSKRDTTRDSHLEQAGVTVLRFPNPATQVDANNILFRIGAECRYRAGRDYSTFPQPSSIQLQVKRKEEKPCEKPRGCQRQVYVSVEIAENAARMLKLSGIDANPERCPACKLLHLAERPTP